MDLLPIARSKDHGREHQHEDDSSTTNLLAPSRPYSQRLFSHDVQSFDSSQSHTSRRWQSFWWLLTVILSAFILATVRIFQRQGNFTSVQKHVFNTISTALILALGLNFFEAFKSLAKGSKSKLLERKGYTDRERMLISNIENLTDVLVLGWESLKKPRTQSWTILFCVAWVIINLVSLPPIFASTELTELPPVVDGTSWNDTYTRPGVANASNITCYAFGPHGRCDDDVPSQARAHANGDIALGFSCGAYNDTSNILESRNNNRYYCRRTRYQQEFAYRFNEYNPNDTQKAYPQFTNRTITASSGHCYNYTMVGEPRDISDGIVFYEYTNGTFSGNITIPGQSGEWDGTTYVYRGTNRPQEAVTYACGPRCIWMWAHKARGHGEASTFYQCPITVNQVSNASNETTQQLSDGMARLAAASIALQGHPSSTGLWTQYQLYAFGSAWEVHFKDPDQVGANMAEFAIGSISTMAYRNPQISVGSSVPYLGSHVEVKWYYLIPLVAGISGAHLALFMFNAWAT